MSYEIISVRANGQEYTGWTDIQINSAYGKAFRDFEIQVTEPHPDSPWIFPPFTEVEIYATGTQVLKGYVEDYNPQADENDHSVSIKGVGLGVDFVDCSCKHETGRFEDKTILQIAQELDVFKIGITASQSAMKAANEIIPWFQIRRGSTPWAELLRLLPQRGLTMMGKADGSIELARSSATRHAGGLVQGVNMKRFDATLSARERFSDTYVGGQSSGDDTSDDGREVYESAQDTEVPRYRPKELMDQAETNANRAALNAQWQSARAAGWSTRCSIDTPGWRDEAGKLWEPADKVFVKSSFMKLEQDMMIEKVTFQQDPQGGTVTSLDLIDPRDALGTLGVSNSGHGWKEAPTDAVGGGTPHRNRGEL